MSLTTLIKERTRTQSADSNKKMKYLNFFNADDNSPSSCNPKYADLKGNILFSNFVIGTLIKQNQVNYFEGDLAESWHISKNKLVWTFILKDNLYDENGEAITAKKYVAGLRKIFKIQGHQNPPPILRKLKGFSSFELGQNVGIIADAKSIIFEFTEVPDGILDILKTPAFGYYAEKNFNSDGSWKDNKKIISSGKYRIESFENDKLILIKNKLDIKEVNQVANKIIFLKYQPNQPIPPFSIIQAREPLPELESLSMSSSSPNILVAFKINSFKSSLLKSKINRQIISEAFRTYLKKTKIKSLLGNITNDFYGPKEDSSSPLSENQKINSDEKLTIAMNMSKLKKEDQTSFNDMFHSIFSSINIKYKIIDIGQLDQATFAEIVSGKINYHLTGMTVDIGLYPQNWSLDFMFCGKYGANFEDPEGKICDFLNTHKGIEINTLEESTLYKRKVNQLIRDAATVIPLASKKVIWHFTNDISSDQFSASSIYPRLDLIELKN